MAKNNYIFFLILFAAIIFLILNLRNQISQKSSLNEFKLVNEKYFQQKNLNEQQILYKRFILKEEFNVYNPLLKDYNMDTIRLTELIKSKALIYRFSISSCSSCVEKNIDYYLEHKDSFEHQFIILCTDEQIFSKLGRTYKYKNISLYLVEDDALNSTEFNDLFSSLYFIIDESGKILTTLLPDNIEMFFDIL